MAAGYFAYEINGTLYRNLSDASHADHILVSALVFEHGVPGEDASPEVFQVAYNDDLLFPNVKSVRLTHGDLADAFSETERRRILDEGVPLPPAVCDRLLDHLIFHGLLPPGSVDRTTRFVLESVLNSEDMDFRARLDEAVNEGEVDLEGVAIEPFLGTHILVDRAVAGEHNVQIHARPATEEELREADATSSRGASVRSAGAPSDAGTTQSGATGSAKTETGQQERREDAFDSPDFRDRDVDPSDDAVPEEVAEDLSELQASVDDDHDFGKSYDFRPTDPSDDGMGIDTPREFNPEADAFDGEPEDPAGTSASYQFGPTRSIEEDLGRAQYQFGPSRSLEEDLGGGVSRSWAKTMEDVARTQDTSSSYASATYDFDTDDLYDFTPPSYDVTPAADDAQTEGADAEGSPGAHAGPQGDPEAERWSTQTVAADPEAAEGAVGAEVVGETGSYRERPRAKTNDPLSGSCLLQAFAVISIIVVILVLALQA